MLTLGLTSQQSSPFKQLPQESNIKDKQNIQKSKQSLMVVYVHSIEPNWDKIDQQQFSFALLATVDGLTRESMKIFKNTSLLQFDRNFFFPTKANSLLKFQLMGGDKNKCYSFIEFPVTKFFNHPRIRHRIQVEMIDKQKINRQRIADKIATIDLQMVHLVDKIGVVQLSVYDAFFDRDTGIIAEMDPYLLIKIEDRLYNTDICKEGGKSPKWNKRFYIPINYVLAQMEIIAYNDNQQLSNQKNMIGTTKNINLMESSILIPTKNEKKLNVCIFYEGKKVGVISMGSKFQLSRA